MEKEYGNLDGNTFYSNNFPTICKAVNLKWNLRQGLFNLPVFTIGRVGERERRGICPSSWIKAGFIGKAAGFSGIDLESIKNSACRFV